ncbi:MAG TPA: adenylate/guanylate cyclase domain-containing protein [Usitatibacter sp.]|nr:adenylate/guanylate cyclase domain-containing protein [Usitatibacter sp.]
MGLACGLAVMAFHKVGAGHTRVVLEPASLHMGLAADWMILGMIVSASALGLFLALRGHRRILTRLLGVSSSALGAGFGLFFAMRAFAIMNDLKVASSEAWLIALTCILLFSIALMAVWMFSTMHFLVQFPKAVRLAGIDYAKKDWNRLRGWRGEWQWKWLVAPQPLALGVGSLLVWMVSSSAALDSDRLGYLSGYMVVWAPFAMISAKQKALDDAGRKAIRWVLLGQSAWLCAFLAAMIGVMALRDAGFLRHGNWTELTAFNGAFFGFFYAGFAIVLLASLAFSMFYDGTIDPDLMIRRTWVLAVVGLGSGVLFVVFERILAGVVADWFGISTVNALTVVAAITAGMVSPMRSWAERLVKTLLERWHFESAIAEGRRQEASIVFADLSGYTALTERDERAALLMAAVFHRDAQRCASQHDGMLVKTIGDAVMMKFASAHKGCLALLALQAAFRSHVEAMGLVPLAIHASIHHGEVVEGPNGDVFGASVNLAARLLGAAGPNEIIASAMAVERNALDGQGECLGERSFKNVALPVTCFKRVLAA